MTDKELFCDVCNGMRLTTPKAIEITHNIKGEEITVTVNVPICSECGSELPDLEAEEYHHDLALNKYRQRKGLLFPEQIKTLREKYGLSQRAFARALGFAEPTINRYELGALQDSLHNNILVLINSPSIMLKIAELNKENLSKREFTSLVEIINKLQLDKTSEIKNDDISGYILKNIEHMHRKLDQLITLGQERNS